ncbi:glycosyltransferase family 2 protein [Cyanobium sp. BA5m-10]|uniref:glycosyltransferase family 2 protein n=1 Tax=Cyanobium sp. BA5m-10 TaxID=2823705 RepID=UPI0020CE1545|nr:glycosyltransferase family 2 protein [Cyanobium sp. BA5m-10]MCP9904870.1 glycosyltransferase family 2 protein [Cyanobium sp. BA5m-10]
MDRSRVAIVIPALNEASTIGHVVRAAGRHGVPWVVDDGSGDATAQVARDAGAIVVSHACNQGYDQALNSGFAAAYAIGCDAFVTLDADGQHDPELLPRILRLLENGADVVIGVRSKRARLAEHIFACVTMLRYGICDPLCGMKAYRASVYAARGHFDGYGSIGTELTLFAAARGFRLEQVPFEVRNRADNPRFGRVWRANLRILRALALSIIRI